MIPWISLIIMTAVAITLVATIIGLKGRFTVTTEDAVDRTTRLRHELSATRQQIPIDPTTGLGNSLRLEDDFTRLAALSQRRGEKFSFVALRATDATHGEPLEGPIMKEIARKLFDFARTEDYGYRLDVDTFGFLLTGCEQAGAALFAERAEDMLGGSSFGDGGTAIFVDTIAGAAQWDEQMGGLEDLIRAAIRNAAEDGDRKQARRKGFETAENVS